jgi:hypothetical protein
MLRSVFSASLVLALASSHVTPPAFPATLVMRSGLAESGAVRAPAWGSPIAQSQVAWIAPRSRCDGVEWGVWREGDTQPLFPVRSVDGGHDWEAAGPMLATDWAGGSLYYVNRVICDSRVAVTMVSGAVIDVSTDAGHQWYQYVHAMDDWSMTGAVLAHGGIGLRVRPASFSRLPPSDVATYRLDVARHRWLRVSQTSG